LAIANQRAEHWTEQKELCSSWFKVGRKPKTGAWILPELHVAYRI
jgi:hypothetical protein